MRSRAPLIIVLAALLILGVLVFFGILHRLRQVRTLLPSVVRNELRLRLGRNVRLGSARLVGTDTALITDLTISERPSFGTGNVLYVRQAIVKFRSTEFLFRVVPTVQSITSITLIEPNLRLVRNKQGELNVADLLRRPVVPPTARFRGFVSIRSGEMTLTNYTADTPVIPAVDSVVGVNGVLDFRPQHVVAVNLTAQGTANRVSGVRVTGNIGLDRPETQLNVAVNNASAGYWLDYFTNIRSWGFSQGVFSGQATITQPVLGMPLQVQGSGRLRNATFTSPYLTVPLTRTTVDVRFINTSIVIAGVGSLRDSPVRVQGTITGFAPARLDLAVASRSMDFVVLQHAIPALPVIPVTWSAPGTLTARVVGTGRNPVITATIAVPRANVGGVPVTTLQASGSYRSGVVHIAHLAANAAGGRITASATVNVRPLTVTGLGTLTGINLAALPIPPEARAGGRIAGNLVFAYRSGTPTGRLTFRITSGRIGDVTIGTGHGTAVLTSAGEINAELFLPRAVVPNGPPVTDIVTRFSVRGQNINISRSTAAVAGGRITANGTATLAGAINVSLDARDVDVETIAGVLGLEQIAGTASFTGTLTGTTRNPTLAGRLSAQSGRIADFPFESLAATVSASARQILLRDVALRSPNGDITAAGNVALMAGQHPRFNLVVAAEAVDIARITSLLKIPQPIEGVLTGRITVEGDTTSPLISGNVTVTDAVVAGVRLDVITLSLETVGGETVIRELVARRGEMRIIGSGAVGPDDRLRLDMHGENLDLNLANDVLMPYLSISGPVDFTATVSGSLTQPIVQAQLTSNAPVVNGIQFDSLTSNLAWDGTTVTLSNTALTALTASYRISLLRYDPTTKLVQVAAAADTIPIPGLIALLRGSPAYSREEGAPIRGIVASVPQPAVGILNSSLDLTVQLAEPNPLPTGAVSLAISGISLAGSQFGDFATTLRFSPTGATIETLMLAGPLGNLTAQGTISQTGAMSVTGRAENVSLAIIRPWRPGEDASGLVDFAFSASGTLEAPQVSLSLRARDIAVAGVALTGVSTDQITITPERISTERLLVQRGGSALVVSGYIPFSWSPVSIPSDQPISVAVQLAGPGIEIGDVLSGDVESASGTLTAYASVTGTLDNPTTSGRISLHDGTITPRHFNNRFTGLNLEARFEGSQIIVDALSGTSSLGGDFSGGGTVNLAGDDRVALFLNLNALRISETNITGSQGETATFTATGRLEIAETIRSPIIQGEVVVSDANVVVPARPVATTVTLPPIPIESQLAVTVNLARNVSVRRGSLQADIVGPLTITGTTSSPIVSGTVQITRGRISYPGRTLQFEPGGTASLLFQPPQPAVLSVNVTAATTITSVSAFAGIITRYRVFLDISGPVGDLTIGIRTNPPGLSDTEALATVFGGPALEALIQGEPAEQVFQQQIGQLLLGFAIPELFQPIPLGENLVFLIEPGIDVPFTFTLAAILTNRLSLTYSRTAIGVIPIDNFAINYTLSPQLAVSTQFEGQYGAPRESLFLIQYYRRY